MNSIEESTQNSIPVTSHCSSAILPPITSLLDTRTNIPENRISRSLLASPRPTPSLSNYPSVPELSEGMSSSVTGSDKDSSRSNSYPIGSDAESIIRLPGDLASIMNMSEHRHKQLDWRHLNGPASSGIETLLPPIRTKLGPQRANSHPIIPTDQKKLDRLKSNREAASRCRIKQKQKLQRQEANLKWYQGQNDRLSREVLDLKMKIMDLKMLIVGHHCDESSATNSVKPASVKRSLSDQSCSSIRGIAPARKSPKGRSSDDGLSYRSSSSRSASTTP